MNPKAKRATVAIGSAALLAAGTYGVVLHGGDSPAQAAGQPVPAVRPAGPGMGGLADRLGVTHAQLRKALEAIRSGDHGMAGPDHRMAASLADALGVSQERVRDALTKLRESHMADRAGEDARVAAAVAKSLGLDEAKVKAALADVGPRGGGLQRGPGGPPLAGRRPGGDPPTPPVRRDAGWGGGPRVDAAAKKLGVSADKLRSALQAARMAGADHRPTPGADPMAADLAKALGLNADKVTTALVKLRKDRGAQDNARRDAFAAKLAKQLGISESKVAAALPQRPRGLYGDRRGPGGFGPGGPAGPGGPTGRPGPPPAP